MYEISIERLARMVLGPEPVTLVDVREPDEYAGGHVPGAVNIPVGQLPGRIYEVPTDAPVHLICTSGNRSSAMTHLVDARGREAVNVVGGTEAWIASGREVETAD